eukprot:228161-Alexandrium_andersonii.AAC.1
MGRVSACAGAGGSLRQSLALPPRNLHPPWTPSRPKGGRSSRLGSAIAPHKATPRLELRPHRVGCRPPDTTPSTSGAPE